MTIVIYMRRTRSRSKGRGNSGKSKKSSSSSPDVFSEDSQGWHKHADPDYMCYGCESGVDATDAHCRACNEQRGFIKKVREGTPPSDDRSQGAKARRTRKRRTPKRRTKKRRGHKKRKSPRRRRTRKGNKKRGSKVRRRQRGGLPTFNERRDAAASDLAGNNKHMHEAIKGAIDEEKEAAMEYHRGVIKRARAPGDKTKLSITRGLSFITPGVTEHDKRAAIRKELQRRSAKSGMSMDDAAEDLARERAEREVSGNMRQHAVIAAGKYHAKQDREKQLKEREVNEQADREHKEQTKRAPPPSYTPAEVTSADVPDIHSRYRGADEMDAPDADNAPTGGKGKKRRKINRTRARRQWSLKTCGDPDAAGCVMDVASRRSVAKGRKTKGRRSTAFVKSPDLIGRRGVIA